MEDNEEGNEGGKVIFEICAELELCLHAPDRKIYTLEAMFLVCYNSILSS